MPLTQDQVTQLATAVTFEKIKTLRAQTGINILTWTMNWNAFEEEVESDNPQLITEADQVDAIAPAEEKKAITPAEAAKNLDQFLRDSHTAILNCESVVVEEATGIGAVRVFLPKSNNIHMDVDDVFGLGLDVARAALKILITAKPDANLTKLKTALRTFHKKMDVHRQHYLSALSNNDKRTQLQALNNAKKEFQRFNGALAGHLTHDANIFPDFHTASNAIKFMRDFLWKQTDSDMPHCTVKSRYAESKLQSTVLSFARPMSFGHSSSTPTEPAENQKDAVVEKEGKIEQEEPVSIMGVEEEKTDTTPQPESAPAETSKPVSSSPNGLEENFTFPWKDYRDQAWYRGLQNQIDPNGQWLNSFFAQGSDNESDFKSLSSTSMTRRTPNPANAYDTTTVVLDSKGAVVTNLSHVRTAITDPLKMKSSERERVTASNQAMLMVSDESLQQTVNSYFERWGSIAEPQTKITIPLLHQTLVSYTVFDLADWKKSRNALNYKARGNRQLNAYLKSYRWFRNKKTGEIKRFNLEGNLVEESKRREDGFTTRINFEVLDTNNTINYTHRISRTRNSDIDDSRRLVDMATAQLIKQIRDTFDTNDTNANFAQLEQMRGKNQNTKDLDTIINFLKSSNHGFFTPYKSRGKKVKEAISNLSTFLLRPVQTPGLTDQDRKTLQAQRSNMALLMQSAVELKCTTHETYFGAARRKVFNTRLRDVPIVGRIFAGIGQVLAAPFKLLSAPFTIPRFLKHRNTRRKELSKAVYEAIVARTLGATVGGCMSSLDRAGEVEAQITAQCSHFAEKGCIVGYNTPPKIQREFQSTYLSTQAKHDFNKRASAAATSSDGATRRSPFSAGLASEAEKKWEQNLSSKTGSVLRKGRPDEDFDRPGTLDNYIGTNPLRQLSTPSEDDKAEAAIKQRNRSGSDARTVSDASTALSVSTRSDSHDSKNHSKTKLKNLRVISFDPMSTPDPLDDGSKGAPPTLRSR